MSKNPVVPKRRRSTKPHEATLRGPCCASLGVISWIALVSPPVNTTIDAGPPPLLLRMTLNALKLRYIAKIHGMLERLVRLMAVVAFVFISERAQINRMLERSGLDRRRRVHRVIDDRVTDIAVIGNHFAGVADMLAVMTAEAS